MLIDKDIEIHITCQQLECSRFDIEEDRSVLLFRSNWKSGEVVFPFCGGRVHVHGRAITTLKDMPLWFGTPLDLEVEHLLEFADFNQERPLNSTKVRVKQNNRTQPIDRLSVLRHFTIGSIGVLAKFT